MDKLNSEQLKNWRQVLFRMVGPYALIMPDEEIQKYRNKLQNDVNKLNEKDIHKQRTP